MTNFRRIFLTGTLALTATGLLSASQIVQTFQMPGGGGSQATNWSPANTAIINQFDTSLGTLEYIQIIAQLNTTVNGSATDASGGATNYTVGGTTQLSLTDGFGAGELLSAPSAFAGSTFIGATSGQVMTVSNASNSVTASETWYADPSYPTLVGATLFTGGFSCSVATGFAGPSGVGCLGYNQDGTAPSSPGYNSGSGITDPLNIASYLGTGTLTLTGNASTSTSITGGPVTGGTVSGTASANVTVIYGYTPLSTTTTPEPATMALFGTGLVGIGLLRRRMSRKA